MIILKIVWHKNTIISLLVYTALRSIITKLQKYVSYHYQGSKYREHVRK